MSLINKMLQDLDARRVSGTSSAEPTIRLMRQPERRSASSLVIGITAVVAVAVLGAGVYAAWRFYQRPAAAVAAAADGGAVGTPAKQGGAQPAASPAALAAAATAEKLNQQRTVIQVVEPLPPEQVVEASAPPPTQPVVFTPVPAPDAPAVAPEPEAAPARVRAPASARVAQPVAAKISERPASARPAARAANAPVEQGRIMSPRQQAEANYRRATLALQEGRIRESITLLKDALAIEPRHDAARQTLVGLLIEAKRSDEAAVVLENGLVIDPRQPAMAMLLARLQIEHGATGIETLMRSLPYAQGDADYQGFLAGALQRAQRHREAIEQYQAAVRSAPGNGVWWMGLGISLQAEKRAPEAAEAYARSLATGTLSPELRNFVERRLDQSRR